MAVKKPLSLPDWYATAAADYRAKVERQAGLDAAKEGHKFLSPAHIAALRSNVARIANEIGAPA